MFKQTKIASTPIVIYHIIKREHTVTTYSGKTSLLIEYVNHANGSESVFIGIGQ